MTAQRHPTSEIVQLEIYGRGDRALCRMKNLSETGAFLTLVKGQSVPSKGDLVRLVIHLNQLGKVHSVDAEVVWTSGLGCGVCFLKKAQLLERMFQKSGPT